MKTLVLSLLCFGFLNLNCFAHGYPNFPAELPWGSIWDSIKKKVKIKPVDLKRKISEFENSETNHLVISFKEKFQVQPLSDQATGDFVFGKCGFWIYPATSSSQEKEYWYRKSFLMNDHRVWKFKVKGLYYASTAKKWTISAEKYVTIGPEKTKVSMSLFVMCNGLGDEDKTNLTLGDFVKATQYKRINREKKEVTITPIVIRERN